MATPQFPTNFPDAAARRRQVDVHDRREQVGLRQRGEDAVALRAAVQPEGRAGRGLGGGDRQPQIEVDLRRRVRLGQRGGIVGRRQRVDRHARQRRPGRLVHGPDERAEEPVGAAGEGQRAAVAGEFPRRTGRRRQRDALDLVALRACGDRHGELAEQRRLLRQHRHGAFEHEVERTGRRRALVAQRDLQGEAAQLRVMAQGLLQHEPLAAVEGEDDRVALLLDLPDGPRRIDRKGLRRGARVAQLQHAARVAVV